MSELKRSSCVSRMRWRGWQAFACRRRSGKLYTLRQFLRDKISHASFKLSPFQHKLCPCCVYESQVNRGFKAHTCPVCREYSASCVYIVNGEMRKAIPSVASNSPAYLRSNLFKEWMMRQHLQELKDRDANGGIFLSCTKMDIREAKISVRTGTCTYSYKENQDGIYEILHPQHEPLQKYIHSRIYFGYIQICWLGYVYPTGFEMSDISTLQSL